MFVLVLGDISIMSKHRNFNEMSCSFKFVNFCITYLDIANFFCMLSASANMTNMTTM